MSGRTPRHVRWILGVASILTPRHRREAWRRQWEAEIEYRRSGSEPGRGLLRFALGSFPHALYLRGEGMRMRGYLADLRHSARALLRRPGFSALTIGTMAIGIGAATAIFSLAEALLLRPLPLEYNDRLVRAFTTNRARGFDRFSVSYPDYADWTARSDLFEASSFYRNRSPDVSGGGDPERVQGVAVHDSFFQTLGSPVQLGRVFFREDHDPGSPITAVLSETFWSSRFGADSTLVGRTIRLDGVPHTVVGIVGDRFAWPAGTDVWTPLQWGSVVPEYADARTNHSWQVIGRLRPGVDVETASDQVRAVAQATYAREDVDSRDQGMEAIVVPLHSSEGGERAGALFGALGAAVSLLLLIACVNASGLLLTRSWSRMRELSLRSALGAGRARLMLILFGESAVLALLGGVVGIALGHVGLERAFTMAPPDMTNLADVQMNATVLAAGAGISVLAALLAGLIPAVRATRISPAESLKESSRQASQGRGGTRLRRGLIVVELALSFALLVSAGLTIRGFRQQITTNPGFDASNLLSFTVRLPGSRYGEEALVDAYYTEAVERLERHPGVLAATSTSRLPLDGGGMSLLRSFALDGAQAPPEGAEFPAMWVEVDPHYFETLGIQPSDGRAFTEGDHDAAPLVAIVNERLARQMSPSESIVGREIRSVYDEKVPRTVVGVVTDLQFNGISRAQRGALVLVPRAQAVRTSMAFLVRTAGDPSAMIPAVRGAMAELDADVALDQLRSLREAHAADLAAIRFLTTLFATFGALALLLAVSGVYGLVSYSVSQRTKEIGVRMAMGATAGTVGGSVIRESAGLVGIGLAIGLPLAYGAARLLASSMAGVVAPELSTFVGVVLVLTAAVVAASWFPAMRATRVDPVEALRSE